MFGIVRYPPVEREYLLTRFGFAFPAIDEGHPLVPLLDHLFGLAVEARRLRAKVERAIANELQELDYLTRSLRPKEPFGLRELYEPLGQDIAPQESRTLARQLNKLEREHIGPLIEAIKKLV